MDREMEREMGGEWENDSRKEREMEGVVHPCITYTHIVVILIPVVWGGLPGQPSLVQSSHT